MGEFSAHQYKEGKTQELACRLHLLPPMPPGPDISHADLFLLCCPALYHDTPLEIKMQCTIQQHRNKRRKESWFAEPSLCIFIASRRVLVRLLDDGECRDERGKSWRYHFISTQTWLAKTPEKVWARYLRSGAKRWCWTGCDTTTGVGNSNLGSQRRCEG